ncbi:MAG: phage holin family protein [Verrucomicrobia bacterium]|nr:phage holin family protein [Verrucomicrobiota bacterium]
MNHPILQLLVRWSVLALGVTIATKLITGIHCDDVGTLVVVVLLLSLFNAVLKPLLVLFTLPFIVLSLGLGMLLINAFLFMLVGRMVEGFRVESFWAALGGALIVSVTNIVISRLIGRKPRPPRTGTRPPAKRDDVIDI